MLYIQYTASGESQSGNSPCLALWFGVAYLLCTLVKRDKTADTHDPRELQSTLCPSAPAQAPDSVNREQMGYRKKKKKTVHLDMQICFSPGCIHSGPGRHHQLIAFLPMHEFTSGR